MIECKCEECSNNGDYYSMCGNTDIEEIKDVSI